MRDMQDEWCGSQRVCMCVCPKEGDRVRRKRARITAVQLKETEGHNYHQSLNSYKVGVLRDCGSN